jgi:hypothetical protein
LSKTTTIKPFSGAQKDFQKLVPQKPYIPHFGEMQGVWDTTGSLEITPLSGSARMKYLQNASA